MLHYLMQHETHAKNLYKIFFTVTEHASKNLCHTAIVAVVSDRNFRISVKK